MASFNSITLVGNVTRDIELSYTPSQTPIAKFGMAMNRKYKDKEEVCFVDLVCFGKQAETLNKYTHKGDSLLVSGRLQFETWNAQDGSKRSKHSVVVENFQFIGGKKQEQSQDEPNF